VLGHDPVAPEQGASRIRWIIVPVECDGAIFGSCLQILNSICNVFNASKLDRNVKGEGLLGLGIPDSYLELDFNVRELATPISLGPDSDR
jgi:hypothetical protein